ncbi:hypothetical protein CQS04_11695 [Chryseomicrobium excrementi]|uniref:Uncharacterized protein n=1 Tax=Chryseomicrobium excrementi TaxID=2041346 RepID=A0A2M9EXF3_9BACL|nr:hypothetical protein [Chryseomicrobium excrementi]PJK15892.1 hypothetical protein CQS04_11695 [Chryseomicrobium excrementi]
MIFHLPFVISVILFIAQSHFGLKHFFRETLLLAVVYTIILFSYFKHHDFVVILYMFLLMFWAITLSTYWQRNTWRAYMKKGEVDYDYES